MKMNIALSDEQRNGVVEILNTLLSDEYVLYTKTRNYHWNVVGPQFTELHEFFEEQYNELNLIIDDVAERTRALGSNALGTVAEFSFFIDPAPSRPAVRRILHGKSGNETDIPLSPVCDCCNACYCAGIEW